MIHVETQPLTQALHHVDAMAVRWVRVLNDSRWANVWEGDDALPRVLRFSESPHCPIKLRLKGDGAQLLVVLDESQWPALHVLKQISDQPRKDAVINLWAHQALIQLRDMGCKVERCHWDSEAQLPVAARVSMQLNGCLVDLYPEALSDRFVDGLQTFLADLPVPMTARLAQWPLCSAVTIGTRAFSLFRIEALKVGDLVFWGASECAVIRIQGDASDVGCAGLVARCRLVTKELIMEEALHEETDMVEVEENLQSLVSKDGEDTRFLHSTYAGLQLNVRFEVDGPAMTVAQAIGLVPGEVIVLPTPVDQARVRLRCQGRCFAYGELVNVGGQMGVRIVEVRGADVQSK